MPENIALFYNPVAGGGVFKQNLDTVIHQFQKRGLQVIPLRINNNAEIKTQLGKIQPDKFHTIIAAGGDGTINGVVNAMMQAGVNIPLGIFPVGTANDVASYLKIPHKIKDYCRVVSDGKLMNLDLGVVNDEYFINVASAGFLTETAHEVDHNLKNVLGKTAYYLKTIEKIPRLQPLQMQLSVDGQSHEMEILMFLILNGGTAGGFQGILPAGNMSDGKLDLLAIKSVPVPRLAQLLYKFSKGQLLQDNNIYYCQGQSFNINLKPSVTTDLDGEKGPALPWKVSVCPHALQVRIP